MCNVRYVYVICLPFLHFSMCLSAWYVWYGDIKFPTLCHSSDTKVNSCCAAFFSSTHRCLVMLSQDIKQIPFFIVPNSSYNDVNEVPKIMLLQFELLILYFYSFGWGAEWCFSKQIRCITMAINSISLFLALLIPIHNENQNASGAKEWICMAILCQKKKHNN